MKLAKPKISTRMKVFLEHSQDGLPFWDICCDHGYVGIAALQSRRFSEVHFVDQLVHIMDRLHILLAQRARSEDLKYTEHKLSAQDIQTPVLGNCLIAGVGGLTIKNILSGLIANNFLKAHRLLLSPHSDEKTLLEFLETDWMKNQYILLMKIDIPEGRRIRSLYILDAVNVTLAIGAEEIN